LAICLRLRSAAPAILLVGGNKSGVAKKMFYRQLIELADRRFDQHQSIAAKEAVK